MIGHVQYLHPQAFFILTFIIKNEQQSKHTTIMKQTFLQEFKAFSREICKALNDYQTCEWKTLLNL